MRDALTMDAPVKLEVREGRDGARIAIATLDAPKSLNALTLDMIRLLDGALERWARDPAIACVILHASSERAFCAGGDVRSLRDAIVAHPGQVPNPDAQAFFSEEYRLDHRIHTYAKPVLVWGGGIVMGGGLGLMAGASHRVVTETTRIAMPEISIGLFPDVGGSWFLSRMPGRCGLFLGLTGAPLNAADAVFTGLADVIIAQDQRDQVIDAVCRADWQADGGATLDRVLRSFASAPDTLPGSEVRRHFDTIQALTAGHDLAAVMEAIGACALDGPWLQRTVATLAKGSPFSAALTWELQRRARHLSLAEVFRLELVVALRCCAYPDFAEGVRALLIDKDNAPRWTAHAASDIAQCFVAPWPQHPLADLN